MKLLKVIGLVFLIFKASLGMSMPMFSSMDMSCCTEVSIADECSNESEDEEKGCCSSNACDCLCCGHIFTISKPQALDEGFPVLPSANNFSFQFSYSFVSSPGIWQPPRLV